MINYFRRDNYGQTERPKTAEHLKVPVYVEAKECTGSTNADCRAQSGEKSGDFAICADCQTGRPRTKGKKLFFTRRRVVSQRRKSVNADDPSKITALAALCDGRGNRKCYREKHRNKVDKRPLCRRQKVCGNSLRKHFGGFFPPFAGDNRYRNKRFAAAGRLPRRHKKEEREPCLKRRRKTLKTFFAPK